MSTEVSFGEFIRKNAGGFLVTVFISAVVATVACIVYSNLDSLKSRSPPVTVTKKIAEKIQSVEQRMTVDFFDKNAVRGRATTVFYLVADDGSTLEVDMKYYTHTDVGDSVESSQWKE